MKARILLISLGLFVGTLSLGTATAVTADKCGAPPNQVDTSVNIGCLGRGNPIADLLFAVIRFLSAGVGIVIIGSVIWAGIRYTTSQGDPSATSEAVKRLKANAGALFLFLFAFAILNWVIPAGFFKT